VEKSEEAATLALAQRQTETTLREIETRYLGELDKSNEKVHGLYKTVKRLGAYIKGATKRIKREAQKAVKRVTRGHGSLNVHHVKTRHGVVEDWIRDLICVLIGKYGTPASRVYELFKIP